MSVAFSTTVAPVRRAVAPRAAVAGRARAARRWPRWRVDAIALVVCLALGVVSALTLPSLPLYDEFSWLVWGREIAHQLIGPHQPFLPIGDTSWKPLPVLFTTIFGFLGAGVTVWVAFVQGVGLYGLYAAYRLGDRLGATRGWRPSGPTAGVLGAVAVALLSGWARYMFRATSEPLAVTAALLWIDWRLAGRRVAGVWCGVALCLARPEASVFLLGDGLWCLWRTPQSWRRLILLAGLVAVPLAWVIPPGLATGHFLQASNDARAIFPGNVGVDVDVEILKRATALTVWPVLVAALALAVVAVRQRDWVIVTLAGVSLGYVAIVELMAIGGYPGVQRFMIPAAAVVCVLAAVAVARLAARVGGGLGSLAVVGAVVAIVAPSDLQPVRSIHVQYDITRATVRGYHELAAAVHRAGGTSRILPCPHSGIVVVHPMATELAWLLDVPVTKIGEVDAGGGPRRPYPRVAILTSSPTLGGGPLSPLPSALHGVTIAHDGSWSVIRITRTADARANACVGR